LGGDALKVFWVDAVGFARWQIGRYERWRDLDEPVLPSGYDAESVVQAAFERLIWREGQAVQGSVLYSGEDIRRELRKIIVHRVRWLHERTETWRVVGEWDVLPPRPDGELRSVFDYVPGQIQAPDAELLRREKEQALSEFKSGFEATLGERKEMVEVFRRICDGQKRREMAREMGAGVSRVKALKARLRRWLMKRGARALVGN
jgi:hypothetical protein